MGLSRKVPVFVSHHMLTLCFLPKGHLSKPQGTEGEPRPQPQLAKTVPLTVTWPERPRPCVSVFTWLISGFCSRHPSFLPQELCWDHFVPPQTTRRSAALPCPAVRPPFQQRRIALQAVPSQPVVILRLVVCSHFLEKLQGPCWTKPPGPSLQAE